MSEPQHGQIPPERVEQLRTRMSALQTAQERDDPNIAQYLKEVHTLVMSYPETVWILTDEEMHAVVEAAQRHANVVIIEEKAKAAKSSRGAAAVKNKTLEDF